MMHNGKTQIFKKPKLKPKLLKKYKSFEISEQRRKYVDEEHPPYVQYLSPQSA